MNVLLTLSYMGTNYHGFQVQGNAMTVQSVFQSALDEILGEQTSIKGCSRTDAGVHAERFCVSFHTENPISPDRLAMALNNKLPADIKVREARYVPEGFHARYSCTGKRYIYKIFNSRYMDPFFYGRAYRFTPRIDEQALNEIAQVFVGSHDFSAFCGEKGKKDDPVRTVSEASVTRNGALVTFSVAADGFLYNMVRIMTGALLNAARGRLTAEGICDIMAEGKRSNLCPTAPACGLYLYEVFYDKT